MKTKNIILFTLLLVLSCSVNAQHDLKSKGIALTRQGYNYVVDFTLPDYSMQNRIISRGRDGNEVFTFIEIPEYGITYEEGKPQLPQVSFFLAIPSDMDKPEVRIANVETKHERVFYRIFPTQYVKSTETLETRKFVIDEKEYSANRIANNSQFVNISEPFVVSGVRGVQITILPFQYNPAGKNLTVCANMKFTINIGKPIDINVAHTESMDAYLNAFFVNYGDCYSTPKEKNSSSTFNSTQYPKGNYLLIVPYAYGFSDPIHKFIEHKTALGYNVYKHQYFGKIEADPFWGLPCERWPTTTPTSIKNVIQSRYNNLPTRPEYVLLVGDHTDVATWQYNVSGEVIESDLGYTQLEGNSIFACVKFGRWPISNEQELENIVNKTITMENKFRASAISPKRATLIADDDFSFEMWFWNTTFQQSILGIQQSIIEDGYSTVFIDKGNGGTPTQVINNLNNGSYLVVYSGHGNKWGWSGPEFNVDNAANLSNTIYPIIFSGACNTGNFIRACTASVCLGEEFIRGKHGACAFFGATRTVKVYWDHWLIQYMFNRGFQQANDISGIMNIAIKNLANYTGNFMLAHRAISLISTNLFGDPSLQFRYPNCESDMKLYAGTTNANETLEYKPATNITVAGGYNYYNSPNQYTVESGGNLTLQATNSIVLGPGFHAKAGSTFSAAITSAPCTSNGSSFSRMEQTPENESESFEVELSPIVKSNTLTNTNFLADAYPNPFSESFTLTFECTISGSVLIRLFDINGTLIKIIANASYDAGIHQLTVKGSELIPGFYFVQINTTQKSTIIRLIKN
jgi:hypothetical protein